MQALLHTCQGRLVSNTEDDDVSTRLTVNNRLALGNASDGYTVQISGFQGVSDAIAFITVRGRGMYFLFISMKLHQSLITGWTHLTSFVQNDECIRILLNSALSARLFVRNQHSALGKSTSLHYYAFDRFCSPRCIVKHSARSLTNSCSYSEHLYP